MKNGTATGAFQNSWSHKFLFTNQNMNSNRSNSNFVLKADGESVESEVNQWSNPSIQRNNPWPSQWFRCLVKGYFFLEERVDKQYLLIYNMDNFIANRWSGDKGDVSHHRESGALGSGYETHCQMGRWGRKGKGRPPSILRRVGMRQLPGVCWYFAKARDFGREPRWHRGYSLFVLDRA